jgi:ABC-type multidrug transport system ATPase subunit
MTSAELRRVSKRYGRHVVLEDITLALSAGEILGLVGPNGAGKTTLLRIVAGLVAPTSGEVVSFFVSRPGAVKYFGGEQTLPADVSARHWQHLWRAPCASPETTRRLGILSRGTRQRVGLDAMLAPGGVSLFLLDEPWEGLDPDASRWLSDQLNLKREAGAAVVVSSHRIHDLASVCDRCAFLVGGRLEPSAVIATGGVDPGDRAARLFRSFDNARGRE